MSVRIKVMWISFIPQNDIESRKLSVLGALTLSEDKLQFSFFHKK